MHCVEKSDSPPDGTSCLRQVMMFAKWDMSAWLCFIMQEEYDLLVKCGMRVEACSCVGCQSCAVQTADSCRHDKQASEKWAQYDMHFSTTALLVHYIVQQQHMSGTMSRW